MQKTASRLYRRSLSKQPPRTLGIFQRRPAHHRKLHSSARLDVVKPFILADIGEGIKEVQIIQWFVQPGARVEQFDKICEVQSDKASVDITSRFDGVIKKLHYEADGMAQVGRPLCDIDIHGDIDPADEKLVTPEPVQAGEPGAAQQPQKAVEQVPEQECGTQETRPNSQPRHATSRGSSSLATPAIRGLLKELKVNIEDVHGTGRDGRVLKEDVQKHAASRYQARPQQPDSSTQKVQKQETQVPRSRSIVDNGPQKEQKVSLTPIQSAMFKSMTKSLSIPHFLFTDEITFSSLASLRKTLNDLPSSPIKLSFLPFVIKAVSIALQDFPLLNAKVEVPMDGGPPKLIMREKHNIGVAMDTPQGLLVPNIKNVAALSVYEIAQELQYLQGQAKAAKLSSAELTGGTITVSNIGSIGGTYTAPLLVQNEVAIVAMGKLRVIPAFDAEGNVVKKTVGNFSWSADHRVIDGATMARMGERVRALVEEPGLMAVSLR